MTEQDQIKALAELDGWHPCDWKGYEGFWYPTGYVFEMSPYSKLRETQNLPNYLTTYDAIIPLIQKVINTPELKVKFLNELRAIIGRRSPKNKAGIPLVSDFDMLTAYTEELCEALLRATGKWKD